MSEKAVRRLPVVDNGRAVGIVSIGDLALERDRGSAAEDHQRRAAEPVSEPARRSRRRRRSDPGATHAARSLAQAMAGARSP